MTKYPRNRPHCNWKNGLVESYSENQITILYADPEHSSSQICYPEILKSNLEELPEQLKKAIKLYFEDNGSRFRLSDNQYQNIYHNLMKKDLEDFDKIALKYQNKAKLARFFKSTNFSEL